MRLFLIGGLLGALWSNAGAQAPGLPVINSGSTRGFTIGGMAGFGNRGAGSGAAFGLNGTYGFRRVAVGGFVSGLSGSTVADATFFSGGATLAVKVAGGPLVPVAVNLHTGAAYSAPGLTLIGGGVQTRKTWHVPLGLGLSWTIAQPVVAIKPWIAPRADWRRVSTTVGQQSSSGSETDFGLSGGVNFGFLNGLGIDVAFDRVFAAGTGSKPTILGVGLSYSLK